MQQEITMKFPPVHLACGDDEMRPSMSMIVFEDGHAVATDAHIVVRVPLINFLSQEAADALEGKAMSGNAWKKLVAHTGKKDPLPLLFTDKSIEADYGIETYGANLVDFNKETREMEGVGKYPKWKDIWKPLEARTTEKAAPIGLNANLLVVAQKILCSDKSHALSLELGNPDEAIKLVGQDGACGLVMPQLLGEDRKFAAA